MSFSHTLPTDFFGKAKCGDKSYGRLMDMITEEMLDSSDAEVRARRLVESIALALEGSILLKYAPREVADAFCASRLGRDHGLSFGTLPAWTDMGAIIERFRPKLSSFDWRSFQRHSH